MIKRSSVGQIFIETLLDRRPSAISFAAAPHFSGLRGLFTLLALILLIQISIQDCLSLTDLDYSLKRLKYSEGVVSSDESFHGANSASLSVFEDGRFSRIYVNCDDEIPVEELDRLSLWLNPQAGNGSLQIEIYLDGPDGSDGADGSGSKKIASERSSFQELGISASSWNEVDGFDLEYEGSESLDLMLDENRGARVSKIYITVYDEGGAGPRLHCYVDYIVIGDEIISFEPLEEEEMKDGPSSATAGGLLTYTITYANNGLEPADVVVFEQYDPREAFVWSDPMPDPGTLDTWSFRALPPGAHGQIKLKVRSAKPAAKAEITGSVRGRGYSFTEGSLSTEHESYAITNTVHIMAGEENLSASAVTRIRPVIGSTLEYGEHGTGEYRADEAVDYTSGGFSVKRSILGEASEVGLNLSSGPVSIKGKWSASLRAENDYRDILWMDRYHEAERINLSYEAQLAKSFTSLESTAQLEGLADRAIAFSGGLSETRLCGNFSMTGRAGWRWANRSISPEKEWLECCPLEPAVGGGGGGGTGPSNPAAAGF